MANYSNDHISSKRTPSEWKVSDTLQEAVDKYIQEDPGRYRAAQTFGDFLVSHEQFSNLDTFKIKSEDLAGEELLYGEVTKMMTYYGIKPKELEQEELRLLQKKLGDTWKEQLMMKFYFTKDDFSE
jgi:hypothetical protein